MFATRLSEILRWVDNECPLLSAEHMRDGFRVRILELTRDFLAFPHCENFALMPDPYAAPPSTSSSTTQGRRSGRSVVATEEEEGAATRDEEADGTARPAGAVGKRKR
jgi:hypothetical protein